MTTSIYDGLRYIESKGWKKFPTLYHRMRPIFADILHHLFTCGILVDMAFKLVLYLATLVQALSGPSLGSTCVTESQPNPIAQQYPNNVTGTVNGTVIVLPIPYSIARSAVPAQYPILTKQYQKWLPWLGQDMYPVVLNTIYDHDIQMLTSNITVADFSVRTHHEFLQRYTLTGL